MGENKTKTKAAMLNELESIKGLLLEEDDIPILQEIIEPYESTKNIETASDLTGEFVVTPKEHIINTSTKNVAETKIFEEQQDFFSSQTLFDENDFSRSDYQIKADIELLDTLDELEKHTAAITTEKLPHDAQKTNPHRPNLVKAMGENPFLPEHIRARLHGNNPPPLFANEAARKIAKKSNPSRQLGNTNFDSNAPSVTLNAKPSPAQDEIIDSIIEKMMPDIEKELRQRLGAMSKKLLDELSK